MKEPKNRDIIHILEATIDFIYNELCTPCEKFVINNSFYEPFLEKAFKIVNIINQDDFELYLPRNYKEFLKTPYWKIIAYWVKKKSDYKCSICNNKNSLNAHHRTYDRHFQEHLYWEIDLICLCNKCHSLFHKNSKLELN